jgi:hypothetical protein
MWCVEQNLPASPVGSVRAWTPLVTETDAADESAAAEWDVSPAYGPAPGQVTVQWGLLTAKHSARVMLDTNPPALKVGTCLSVLVCVGCERIQTAFCVVLCIG